MTISKNQALKQKIVTANIRKLFQKHVGQVPIPSACAKTFSVGRSSRSNTCAALSTPRCAAAPVAQVGRPPALASKSVKRSPPRDLKSRRRSPTDTNSVRRDGDMDGEMMLPSTRGVQVFLCWFWRGYPQNKQSQVGMVQRRKP